MFPPLEWEDHILYVNGRDKDTDSCIGIGTENNEILSAVAVGPDIHIKTIEGDFVLKDYRDMSKCCLQTVYGSCPHCGNPLRFIDRKPLQF